MCIIAVKEKGVAFPEESAIVNCFESNPDGAGFMYNDEKRGAVIIKKGFMTLESFLAEYRRHAVPGNLDKTYVFHFRIATHGSRTATMTHPFPVTTNEEFIGLPHVKAGYGFAHNGILHRVPTDIHHSDTAVYVMNFLSKINLRDKELTEYFLDATCENSKFVLLYPDGSVISTGAWIQDGKLYYSHGGFRSAPAFWNYQAPGSYWVDGDGDDDRYANYWSNVSQSKTKVLDFTPVTKRLPAAMVVYADDGEEIKQGSALLEKGEWFEISETSIAYVCHYDEGVLKKDYYDYVTTAEGEPVILW